jgi:glycosyltransferase involved in cell wall biosynthesis
MECRLFYLVGQLRAGGLERQLCYLLQTMNRDRYRPAVAVWNYHEEDIYVTYIRALDVPLYPLPWASSRAFRLEALRRLIRQIKPEVIHSYSFYTNFAAWWAALGTRATAVGAVRGDFTRDREMSGPLLGRLSARWPRSQVFNSFAAAETARRSRSLFTPGQLSVVRNGLDLQRFRTTPLSTVGRARILAVGSLLPVKRWDRLLAAALALKQRRLDFLVQIVGDGPLRGSLKNQVELLRIADCVEFVGHSDNVPALLADATLLVHPSDSEGCPNVVMEAMACGRPVVATDVGDVPLLVQDGKTGFVVSRGDTTMLVERLASLIVNRDLCRQMGEAGRAKAELEFGLHHLVGETLAAYLAAGWKDF